ncbi:MAG TPA: vanadium-dependent haloperoxidase [Cyclobacteriaceae bacterium]|nr:vanadium-dependent haloperoxidase [Cyclobacteriaceae bacterium]
MRTSAFALGLFLCLITTASALGQTQRNETAKLRENVFHLSEVMLRDGTNPPAAARFYSYSLLGAYTALLMAEDRLRDITPRLHKDPEFRYVRKPKSFASAFAAQYTMLEVGRRIMPSGQMLSEHQQNLIREHQAAYGLTERQIAQNVKFAVEVANQVLAYASTDGYGKLSTFTRYTPRKGDAYWYPTPPVYMEAVEPNWETVRPFFLESADQFTPPPATEYSNDTTSAFHQQVMEVYQVGRELTEEQRLIASFWDCNPFAVKFSGHMAIGLKKISPGGHWMGIAGIASHKKGLPLDSAVLVHTVVAMTLHDAFISCWQEKFASHRVRPETVINRYIDPDWRPLLQTPPFPEYTSGHSVASASAAVVLTHFFGDAFSFLDDTEVYFGLPERQFDSFYDASNEAAISRLYGGIHYRDACDAGVEQGRNVGDWAVRRLTEVGDE